MSEQVHDCVESVLADNPDMDEEEAWAICQSQIGAESVTDVESVSALGLEAGMLDDLAAEANEWVAGDGVWSNSDAGLVIYDAGVVPITNSSGTSLPTECRACGDRARIEGSFYCPECHPGADGADDHDLVAQADTGEIAADDRAVTVISGLSQEAREDIENRYNADVLSHAEPDEN